MRTKVVVPVPVQTHWDNPRDGVARMTVEIDFHALLDLKLTDEYAKFMEGLTMARDAEDEMRRKITPPRFLPEEDAAMLARVGLPFELEIVDRG